MITCSAYSAYIASNDDKVNFDIGFEAEDLCSKDQAKEVLEILESALRKDRDKNHLTSNNFISFIVEDKYNEHDRCISSKIVYSKRWSHKPAVDKKKKVKLHKENALQKDSTSR